MGTSTSCAQNKVFDNYFIYKGVFYGWVGPFYLINCHFNKIVVFLSDWFITGLRSYFIQSHFSSFSVVKIDTVEEELSRHIFRRPVIYQWLLFSPVFSESFSFSFRNSLADTFVDGCGSKFRLLFFKFLVMYLLICNPSLTPLTYVHGQYTIQTEERKD